MQKQLALWTIWACFLICSECAPPPRLINQLSSNAPDLFETNTYTGKRDGVIEELIYPPAPVTLTLNQPTTLVFRTNLIDRDQEHFIIYLARQTTPESSYKILVELSRCIVSKSVSDYIIYWTPKESDGIPADGGSDFLLVAKRTEWWGWRREVDFESGSITISPS